MSFLSDLLGDAYKEDMTADEISAALEAKKKSEDTEVAKLKNALSKANSEAAEYKKQLREKQTDDEAAEAARKELEEKLQKENTELKRSIALSERKASLLSIGYDAELAEQTATAMVDGDMETVIKNQSVFVETQKKNYAADLMKQTPRPATGSDNGGGLDYDKLISEAQANSDYTAAAYYTRLKAEQAAAGNNP